MHSGPFPKPIAFPLHLLLSKMCPSASDLLTEESCSETFPGDSHPTHSTLDHFLLSVGPLLLHAFYVMGESI